MKRDSGCSRNRMMRGGGTATFSMGGMVQPGFYPEAKVIDSCSVARPGMIQMTPKGLMGGRRRRGKHSTRRVRKSQLRKSQMRGGMYKLD